MKIVTNIIAHFLSTLEKCVAIFSTTSWKFDKVHRIRGCVGTGLRASIWSEFQERFQIPKIVEFYGSTEGTAGFVNLNGHVGAVGYICPLIPSLTPIKFVKVNSNTSMIIV